MNQFDESKHPRDEAGKFTDGVGTKAEQEKLAQMGISVKEKKQDTNLTNEEKRLQELTEEKADKELTEEEKKRQAIIERDNKNIEIIRAFKPVKQQIVQDNKNKDIYIKFTQTTAEENIFEKRRVKDGKKLYDIHGYRFKIENIKKLPSFIANAKYMGTSPEQGKTSKAHLDAKMWHYFTDIIHAKNGKKYKVIVNVKENFNGEYIAHLLQIKRLKNKKQKGLPTDKPK